MRMSPVKLSELLRPFQGKWVALDKARTKIVASGNSPEKVAQEARSKAEEQSIMTFVPLLDLDYVG